ncbi:unnamed protein product [Boreogadus saida]
MCRDVHDVRAAPVSQQHPAEERRGAFLLPRRSWEETNDVSPFLLPPPPKPVVRRWTTSQMCMSNRDQPQGSRLLCCVDQGVLIPPLPDRGSLGAPLGEQHQSRDSIVILPARRRAKGHRHQQMNPVEGEAEAVMERRRRRRRIPGENQMRRMGRGGEERRGEERSTASRGVKARGEHWGKLQYRKKKEKSKQQIGGGGLQLLS